MITIEGITNNEDVRSDIVINRNWSNQTSAPFSFYTKLNYPQPNLGESISRTSKDKIMAEYLDFIQKRKRIFQHIPFIQEVFLANSITFNALKKTSDIDLFIIARSNHLWTARFFTSIIMSLFNIKRNKKKSQKRFCLSFFITPEAQNLQKILLNHQDIYLPYWIAHLVPLYQSNPNQKLNFYSHNTRVKTFLPNWTPTQHIKLGISIEQGSSRIKNKIEKILNNKIGHLLEKIIIKIRTPFIKKKIKENPELHTGVIFNETILKFHYDKRAEYSKKIFKKNS